MPGGESGGAKPAQQKTLPTKVRDTGQVKREPGQHVLFCYLFSRTLVSDVSFRSLLDLALWV